MAIANVINLFDPGFVVLGGGLLDAGEYISKALRQAIQDHSLVSRYKQTEIKKTTLADNAGALGAAMMPIKDYFEIENIRL